MDGRDGGERKQTERQKDRQTDRQIKREVCQKEMEGEKRAKEKRCKGNSKIPYTMYKNVYFEIYMHYEIKQKYLLYSIKNISITLL
jgi:hypothetical protein